MATRTASRNGGRSRSRLLPANLSDLLRRRLVEGAGFVLTVVGLLLIVVLLTYDRSDPSWNTAVNPEANPDIRNILGIPGAWTADLLLQGFGIAGYMPGALLMAWGLRIMSHRGLSRVPLRAGLALATMLLAAAGFAGMPAFEGWQLSHAHLGGTGGALLLDALGALPVPTDRTGTALGTGVRDNLQTVADAI